MAAVPPGPLSSRRLIITDRNTKQQYLIDTGSDVSIYPRKFISRAIETPFQLSAAKWLKY